MNYQQTIGYLYSQLPVYHRIGPAAYKANLDNTLSLCSHLGNPERRFRSIHIAGTNGKGSVAHMLASVFAANGYKTGLATSPHLRDFRERIKINGKKIPKTYVTDFVHCHRKFFEPLGASFFEISIALTFSYFADEKVDIAIMETGLGGRLDSTNVIIPELSVITNIGFDHTNLLGNTLEKIASEKAGIIKKGIPVVIGRKQDEIIHVFERKCSELDAPMFRAGEGMSVRYASQVTPEGNPVSLLTLSFKDGTQTDYRCDLAGNYQQENMVTALSAIQVYRKYGSLAISEDAVKQGLAGVAHTTGLVGRWLQIGKRPRIICDTAHNPDGMEVVIRQLLAQGFSTLRMVFGMVDDKDIPKVLSLLPSNAVYYFCRPDVPRGLSVDKLAQEAAGIGLTGIKCGSVKAALALAKAEAASKDLIFVGGSTFVVAEVV